MEYNVSMEKHKIPQGDSSEELYNVTIMLNRA